MASAFGDNPDEYLPEAEMIAACLPGARSADDVGTLVHEESCAAPGSTEC